MIKNYFKTAWRTIQKNKVYSFITVIGLTIGLWACMIVSTIVIDDLSYDKHWSRANDLYRIVSVNKMAEGIYDRSQASFAGLAPELKKSYPEVEAYSELRVFEIYLKRKESETERVKVQMLKAETSVWSMLDISVLSGNPKQYIEGSNNLLITESFRKKFFKEQNPVGNTIYNVPSYEDKATPYIITGVIKDLPSNTHLRADVILLQNDKVEALEKTQYGTFRQIYILMRPRTDMKNFTAKVNKWYKGFVTDPKPYQYEFQPLTAIYLKSDFAQYQQVKGSVQTIYILSGVAALLLLIACVNFINLSTARAITRLKEAGVRKILGAVRMQLIFQFLTEAIMFFSISTCIAILLYQFSLKPVEVYLGHPLSQTFIARLPLFAATCGIIFLMSLFTGIYPAWLISGFKPANTLKGKLFSNASYGQVLLRKSLVVLQFSISIVVLLAMIIVQQQVRFMENNDVGFNKKGLINISQISWDNKGGAFKNELLNIPGVESASISTWAPSQGAGYMSREIDDPNNPGNKINVWYISGEVNLAQTLGLQLKMGRLLSKEYSTDAMNEDSLQRIDWAKYEKSQETRPCLITATTAKILQINKLNNPLVNVKAVPVGVIDDFHNESLRELMGPTVIFANRDPQYGNMLIRIKPGTEKQVMASLPKLFQQFYPIKLLEMNWVEELLNKQYQEEKKLQQLFTFFSGLSMFLAALGVFGLIVHATKLRTKEIGIRKVLGASVAQITTLLSKDFIRLVLIAILISSPIAWYAMNQWLQDFAYRIVIEWWVFLLAGILALLIALVTVSFQAIKAALANPVKSLRTE